MLILNSPQNSKGKIKSQIKKKNINLNLINFTSSTKSILSLGSTGTGANDQFNQFTNVGN